MPDEKDLVSIRMSARSWSAIDGELDNVASLSSLNGPQAWLDTAQAIRREGWRQVPWVDGEWPPMSQEIELVLTRGQWTFALERIEAGLEIYRSIGDDESEALGLAAARTMREAGV